MSLDEQLIFLFDNISHLEEYLFKIDISKEVVFKIKKLIFNVRKLFSNLSSYSNNDITKYYKEFYNILNSLKKWPLIFHPIIIGTTNLKWSSYGFQL